MKRSLRLMLHALLAGVIVTAVGCKKPVKPMKFNNTIARSIQRLEAAGRKFYGAVQPVGDPRGNLDVNAVQTAYNEVQKVMKEVKAEVDAMEAPIGAAGADLLAKARDFMQAEQTVFDQIITPIFNIIRDNAVYPDSPTKWAAIKPLLVKAEDVEKPGITALQASQTEFCKQQSFEIR